MEMKKYIFPILVIITLLSLAFVLADKPTSSPASVNPSQGHANVIIPENAIEVAPGVFSLGAAQDVDGTIVEGYAFVKQKKEFSHNSNNQGSRILTNSCFSLLAKGAKWKTVENYIVDPINRAGLNSSFIRSNIASDISQWEDAADGSANGIQGANILGNEIAGTIDGADSSSPDGKNEVLFADISNSGAIGVTIVWGIFSGPTFRRELVEWDQVYDDADFAWSQTGEAGKMDFWNIAIHEIGHAAGMGHPSDSCTEETMFRYAGFGETKKRDLNAGDITGIKSLYS